MLKSIVVGDMDADGVVDLAAANEASDNVTILLGNGDGTLGVANDSVSFGGPLCLAVADVNRDGIADVVTGKATANMSVKLELGNGTLGPAQLSALGCLTADIAIADLITDDFVDLVFAASTPSGVTVILGASDGAIGNPVQVNTPGVTPAEEIQEVTNLWTDTVSV